MNSRFSLCGIVILIFITITSFTGKNSLPVVPGNADYKNPALSVDKRVDDLLKRMSMEEKIAQLQCRISVSINGDSVDIPLEGLGGLGMALKGEPHDAAIKNNIIQKYALERTRLGIPILMHDDAIHGLSAKGSTSYPQAIGLAATFDTTIMAAMSKAIALESKARGIRLLLSPTINVINDSRWGRVGESYGEDPYLTSCMGVAYCKYLEKTGVLSDPKHYVANIGDGGLDSHEARYSERMLREVFFPPFKACIQEGGARTVMAAYNSLDGIPCSSNNWLLNDILRKEWGFTGIVVSDYFSLERILYYHKTAANEKETAKQALEGGLDVELPSINIFGNPLAEAIKEGMIQEETINTAVRRILRLKFEIGLFENPWSNPDLATKENDSKENRQLALNAARKSIVLLKNTNQTLPLTKKIKTLALLGRTADIADLGDYSGSPDSKISVLKGLQNKLQGSDINLLFEKIGKADQSQYTIIPSENFIPPGAKPGQHGLKAEYYDNINLTGAPKEVRIDKNIDFEFGSAPAKGLGPEKFSVRWTGKLIAPITGQCRIGLTTDDGVLLYIDGKVMVNSWTSRIATTDDITLDLVKGREYDIRIDYFNNLYGGSAQLGWKLNASSKDDSDKALAIASQADAVVIVTEVSEGEGKDRANLDLPGNQEKLIKAVAASHKPVIVILINGGPVTMQNWGEDANAIVEAWYAGEEGGNAIADVLFGDYNPGAKLPLSFPVSSMQLPMSYIYKPSGRTYDYVDMSSKPLYPFGYGLSYTTFEYSDLKLSATKAKSGTTITASVVIKNTGQITGDEVVQLYLHDVIASVARPMKELKGFQRVTLEPGKSKTISFEITPEKMQMLDKSLKWVIEPGTFEVLIGSSSEDIRQSGIFEVIK